MDQCMQLGGAACRAALIYPASASSHIRKMSLLR